MIHANANIEVLARGEKIYITHWNVTHIFNSYIEAKGFIDSHYHELSGEFNPLPICKYKVKGIKSEALFNCLYRARVFAEVTGGKVEPILKIIGGNDDQNNG